MYDRIPSWVIAGIGVFTIVAAILDWNWFFNHPRAKFFVDTLGRNGARVFYVVLGGFIIVLSQRFCPPPGGG